MLGQQTPMASDDVAEDLIISQNPAMGDQIPRGQAVDITYSTGKDQVAVPNLVNLSSPDDAETMLIERNLVLGNVRQVDSEQPAGTVLSQNPAEGTLVDPGTPVSIRVSNGQVEVPRVVGDTLAEAQAKLINAGFQPNPVEQETDQEPPGTVLAQSPQGGATASKGSQVTLTVAKAPPPPVSPTPPPPSGSQEAPPNG